MTMDWNGKQVIIIGAARQGLALARYLLLHGARVTITDRKTREELEDGSGDLQAISAKTRSVEWVLGENPASLVDEADWVFVSGGVPLTNPIIVAAMEKGIPVSNDSQLFMEVVPCTVVGITGSAGKTTTTSLVGEIAQRSNLPAKVWVGGNIGVPLIDYVDEMQPEDLAVVEFSSFQLELMNRSPQVAAVLNITPNHLDRHESMDAYSAIKARIVDFQGPGDMAVLGRDDPGSWKLAERVHGRLFSFGIQPPDTRQPGREGTYVRGEILCLGLAQRLSGKLEETPIINRDRIRLRGEHNLANVLAACAIAAAAGLPVFAMQEAVDNFQGVPHRLEYVRTWRGADWYNDSIATAPERAIAAIRSFSEPLILLAGGRDKNLPWEEFAALVSQRVDHLILFGESVDKILGAVQAAESTQAQSKLTITCCPGLREAVQKAAEVVQPGDVVLLAPGGTSFDEFKDFEERGVCFSQWVNELK